MFIRLGRDDGDDVVDGDELALLATLELDVGTREAVDEDLVASLDALDVATDGGNLTFAEGTGEQTRRHAHQNQPCHRLKHYKCPSTTSSSSSTLDVLLSLGSSHKYILYI